MPLVRESSTALYEQISRQLQEEIQRGVYAPSGKLPSEAELGARYAVSRVTVRLALRSLEQHGIIVRKQGKGTYVARKQVRHELNALRSFHEALQLQGLNPIMEFISGSIQPLPDMLRDLFAGQTKRFVLQRLHLVDQEPVALGCSYLPVEMERVDWRAAKDRPIYAILETFLNLKIARADMQIRAQLADHAVAQPLGIKEGTALLILERTSFLDNGAPCDRSLFYIRPERYSFVLSNVYRGGS